MFDKAKIQAEILSRMVTRYFMEANNYSENDYEQRRTNFDYGMAIEECIEKLELPLRENSKSAITKVRHALFPRKSKYPFCES